MVSICVPTYNGARFLSQCLDTALAQTWSDFELVIVDDRSTDRTLEIAAGFAARDSRVRLHQNDRNLGLAGNWNQCVHLSRGQWIKFLFQDDLLDPTCIARMLAIRRTGVPLIVVRRVIDIEPNTPEDLKRWYQRHAAESMIRRLFSGASFVNPNDFAARVVERPTINCIGEPTATLIHRSAFDRFGPFNSNLRVLTDWEFFARIAVHHGLCYVDDELATFRVHSKSTTQTELARSLFLDPLVMLHELAYSDTFEPVRVKALLRRYPIDFGFCLAREVRRAHRQAKHYARAPGEDSGRALVDLAALIRIYPKLTKTPRGYLIATVSEFLRNARWSLTRRAEGLVLNSWRAIRWLRGRFV